MAIQVSYTTIASGARTAISPDIWKLAGPRPTKLREYLSEIPFCA
ncbi:MAG TPA: hypothetical protein VJ777_31620 [Mycobacterium sp.]|nr:hypothetical protein [Mycobacterium sp.]